ncbi:MAG TPA: hypothetical protein VFU05_17190 [Cyclobacteriaceae bacterium]|nr:hypothetical protein [Cyclobacteriaceae bacterium]
MKPMLKLMIAVAIPGMMISAGSVEAIGQVKKAEPSELKRATSANDSMPLATAKAEIKKEALPKAALSLLEGDGFKGWTIAKVYRVKVKDEKETDTDEYEVEVKKDDLSQVLKFDKDGNLKKESKKEGGK